MLQYVIVHYGTLQYVIVHMLQYVTVCYGTLQYVIVRILQYVIVRMCCALHHATALCL